ncbi:hypothetical protein SDC9_155760 [bioreactor metagenome]|uniref:Uncharacterized protein n=1 Tax=bioreactor metagenome TaxID=1076179 RepID=A0A645F2D8_9ZZZZ
MPVVFAHVAQRCGHAALSSHSVRASGENLGQRGDGQTGARQFQRSTQAGAAGTDDHDVKLALGDICFGVAHS